MLVSSADMKQIKLDWNEISYLLIIPDCEKEANDSEQRKLGV